MTRKFWHLLTSMILGGLVAWGGFAPAADTQAVKTDRLSVINYSDRPVAATAVAVNAAALYEALGVKEGTPLKATRASSASEVPTQLVRREGKPVVLFYLSLRGRERVDLALAPAGHWAPPDAFRTMRWDATRHEGTLSNGVVALRFKGGKYDLSFAGPAASGVATETDREILKGVAYYGWLDRLSRGRIADTRQFDPERPDGLDPGSDGTEMIPTPSGRIIRSEATVQPNGDLVLRVVKGFDGFAREVTETDLLTLPAGLPVVRHELIFETRGTEPVYVAYVGRGGFFYGRYAAALRQGARLMSDSKTTTNIPLGSATLRIGWVPEPVWAGLQADSGLGLGITTLRKLPGAIMQGAMVWQFSPSSFQLPPVEHTQGRHPFAVRPGQPAVMGIAFVATSGGATIAPDARNLLGALHAKRPPAPSAPYAVYLGERVLQAARVPSVGEGGRPDQWFAATATGRESGMMRLTPAATGGPARAALELDFSKQFIMTFSAARIAPGATIQLTASALEGTEAPLPLTTVNKPGPCQVDLNAATRWTGAKRFRITATAEGGPAELTVPVLRRKPYTGPVVVAPAEGASITDLAVFYRWERQEDAREYELQMARNANFSDSQTVRIKGLTHYLPPQLQAPGEWHWRVRALAPDSPGEWSVTRRFMVNDVHTPAPLVRRISPERPLFTIEAVANPDLAKLCKAIPEDMKSYFAIVVADKRRLKEVLAPAHQAGVAVLLRTHHPSPQEDWLSLADAEQMFQLYPNVIGAMGGEALTSFYKGDYCQRLVRLCAKYGRIFHEGDGCYDENKWQEVMLDPKAGKVVRELGRYIVFSQKNNIFNKQLLTQSAVMGYHLSGLIGNQGAWEDGGWYWAQVGFRKLGEYYGARTGVLLDTPPIFWNLTFLMGLSRGATVFSMDGQGGVSMHGTYDPTNPKHRNQTLWTSEGQRTETFDRYVLPFLRAVIRHKMVLTREQVLANVRLAVSYDGEDRIRAVKDDRYHDFWALYAGTYGFRPQGQAKGEVYEFFPNTGRYYYIPVLPPGVTTLGGGSRTVGIGDLQDEKAVRELFDRTYPKRYEGDALVTVVGDIVSVLNTHENQDVTESYSIPLKRGSWRVLTGRIGPHAYLMGKFEDEGRRFWMQANTNYPERDTQLSLICEHEPRVVIVPASAVKERRWDGERRQLHLVLTHKDGAAEITLDQGER